MTISWVLVQFRFVTSKVGRNINCNKLCTVIAAQVAEWLKTRDLRNRKYWENVKIGLGHSLIPSLPFRNNFFAMSTKIYEKAFTFFFFFFLLLSNLAYFGLIFYFWSIFFARILELKCLVSDFCRSEQTASNHVIWQNRNQKMFIICSRSS